MSGRRMLHKSISQSKQVNKLPLEVQLLFTWLIAHADDDGKLNGDPEFIKISVVPYKKWSVKKVKEYLELLRDVKLIYFWKEYDEYFIEFIKWTSYQQIQKDRYHASRLPSFNDKNVSALDTESIQENAKLDTESNQNKPSGTKSENKPNEIVEPFDNPFSDKY